MLKKALNQEFLVRYFLKHFPLIHIYETALMEGIMQKLGYDHHVIREVISEMEKIYDERNLHREYVKMKPYYAEVLFFRACNELEIDIGSNHSDIWRQVYRKGEIHQDSLKDQPTSQKPDPSRDMMEQKALRYNQMTLYYVLCIVGVMLALPGIIDSLQSYLEGDINLVELAILGLISISGILGVLWIMKRNQ
ncbi:hypothetical protein [Risungbinella massiliensis]|uniref:hypothetical protein n=1 Tax=Risungbinella massiliensis TaxID=1329796 RepID=UPI0005CC12D7|nr:hypothetical protein [Risungbinella massiliensis]